MSDLDTAIQFLKQGHSCVAVRGEAIFTSDQSGIAPLLLWEKQGLNLQGFAVADRLIGRASALLLVNAGAKSAYTPTLSLSGQKVLEQYNIPVRFETLIEQVLNKDRTDMCPMEKASMSIEDPKQAVKVLRETISKLRETA